MDIVARIDALLANTPPSEVEQFEVCRCLRDAKGEIERLRLTDAERRVIESLLIDPDFAPAYSAATLRGLLRRMTL